MSWLGVPAREPACPADLTHPALGDPPPRRPPAEQGRSEPINMSPRTRSGGHVLPHDSAPTGAGPHPIRRSAAQRVPGPGAWTVNGHLIKSLNTFRLGIRRFRA